MFELEDVIRNCKDFEVVYKEFEVCCYIFEYIFVLLFF